MNPRTRLLIGIQRELRDTFCNAKYVTIRGLVGKPPHKYRVTYRVRGTIFENGCVKTSNFHEVDIIIPPDYPHTQGTFNCIFVTSHFHPNIYLTDRICLWDHHYAYTGESIVDTIRRIGDMIMFKSYNLKSTANNRAAMWAKRQEAAGRLPLDDKDIMEKEQNWDFTC